MGQQKRIRNRKLAKALLLLTSIFVAAMFIGSAAAAGVKGTQPTMNAQTQTQGNSTMSLDSTTVTPNDFTAQSFLRDDHNLGILSIDTPESGNAGIVIPTVTVTNYGTSDEYSVPLQLLIGTRQVTSTLEDFEATDGGYTVIGSPSIIWEWGTPTLSTGPSAAHSGTNLWGTDLDSDYPVSTNQKLTSPAFVVPPYGELTFWHWYDTEAYYDGGNVKISNDGGNTWTILTPAGGYPEDAASTMNAGIPGEPCFSGHIQKYWEEESIDLSAYSGQTVQIRFHFGSDGSVNYPGWYIDDVSINAIAWVNEYNETQTFDIAAGATVQVSMPAWTPAALNAQEDLTIDYNAEATVTLAGDTDPADNYLAKPFSLYYGYFHDVAVTQIVAPVSGLAEPQNPEVALANNGQNAETVNVTMNIQKAAYTLYLEEYFEGDFPPAGWTNQIIQNHGWVRNDQTIDQRPNYAGGEGYCADADADDLGSGGPWPMECALISPSMDLSTVTGAVLTCTEAFNSLGGDYADVDISVDGGTTWTNLQHWTEDHSPSGPGENVQFDLSSYCGNADVKIRFLYYADGWDWYFEVDNVKVYTIEYSTEYDAYQSVDIDAGATMNVVFPETWTPSDMMFGFDIDYRVTSTASLAGFITIGTEGFEEYTAGHYDFPAGWTVTPTNPASTWFVYGTGTTSTPKCQETNSLGVAQNELLTSPASSFVGMNSIRLKYTAYFYRSSTVGDSYVEVLGSLDGGATWPTLITTYIATGGVSYSEDFDISSWAANQPSVTIGYRFVSDADSDLTDYFYFDNFWVGDQQTIVTEGFNNYVPGYYGIPSGWTVIPTNPTSTWFVYGTGTTSQMKCQETGKQNLAQNELLTSPLFNLGGMTVVKLQYSAYFYRSSTNGDSYVEVLGSTDGGVTWPVLIKTYNAVGGVSYSEDIDISSWAANQPTVVIGYRFVSPADANLTDYFYFDGFWIGNEQAVISEYFNNFVAGYYAMPTGWTIQVTNPTGKWYLYQSGTTVYPKVNESGSNGQAQNEWCISKTIDCSAQSNVSLQFTKYFYKSTTGGDSYGQVLGSIDGGATWPYLIFNYTATSSTAESKYITSWAAGQANVKIAFHFVSTADASLYDYFYFDDFFVGVMWGPYGNNPPTGWTILDYGSQSPPVWDTNDWHRYSTSTYAAQGQFARVYYSPSEATQNELLISPSVDCTVLTSVNLSFWHYWYRSSVTTQLGWVNGSTDGGVTFPYPIAAFTTNDGPAIKTYDISAWAAGQSNVKIQYQYRDQNGNGYYWYVDDFKIASGTTTIYSQNFEGVGYFENFGTNYIPANWGPLGWYVTPTGDTHWSVTSTNYAGGSSPEARFYYSPAVTSDISLCSGPMDTSAYTTLTLSFKHYVDWYANPFTLKVDTSTDGITWGTVWSISPTGDIPASTVTVPLNSTQGIGSTTFRMRFMFSGYTNNINYWYIDNVKLGTMVTIYTTGFDDNWIPPNWGPLGWQVSPPEDTHWSQSATNYAGGTSPELKFSYSPSQTGNFSFVSGTIDTSGYTTLTLAFNHYVNHYTTPYTLKVETTGDGTTWGTVWSISPTASIPATTVYVPLGSTEGIGSSTFQLRFTFSGYTFNINYWYIDDMKLGNVVTVYNTTFNENWVPTSWGLTGWAQVVVSGTDPDNEWDVVAGGSHPTALPHGGTHMAQYDSYNISSGNSCLLYLTDPVDFQSIGSSAYQATLWMYHDPGYSSDDDRIEFQVSLDGTSWTTVDSFSRYAAVAHWEQHIVDLSAYATEPAVYLGFLGVSEYGNSIYMDDLSLQYYGVGSDENPSDNELVQWITLTYEHDVGVTEITEPSYPIMDRDITWFTYGGDNSNSIGLTSGGTFEGAIRLSPTELAAYDGQQITTVSYHHGSDYNPSEPATNGYFKFYGPGTATQPGALLYSEPFSTPAGADWFTQTLATPIDVDVTQDIWFSIECDNTNAGEYPLGCDSGPAVDTKADWASLDGGATWIELQIYGLDYNWNHMVGFEPKPSSDIWPPGTYSVAGIVANLGVTFPESNIPVEATITHVDNSTVIYDEMATVSGPLAPGDTASVTFPDFTLLNLTAWEGKYKVEIKTALAGDDHPENNKKSMTFTMAITDVIPPITNYTITGTMGNNGWYVSNVIITLTAIDPAPPMKAGPKPPSGVAHTYYKLHAADNWTEYDGSPITVGTDGTYELFYYSVDNAGNVEPVKGPIAFKLDKTAPTITLTVMALNALKTKWLLNATVDDATSGVAFVEFYVDDVMVGNATAYPYTYTYKGNGKVAQAIVYDNAGNSAMSAQVNEYIPNVDSQTVSTPDVQQNQVSSQQILLWK